MTIPCTFSVLRYIHDTATEEFVNIGVAVYSKEVKFLRARCTNRYGRITEFFDRIDGERFRQLTRYIENEIVAVGDRLPPQLPFDCEEPSIEKLLAMVLPPDDTGIQFSPAGVGLTDDLDAELAKLYDRCVERYMGHNEVPSRNDEDVWRVFRQPLEQRNLANQLSSKRIIAPNFEYEFRRSWKNEIWHVYEPVSFDLANPGSILDKANRWLGQGMSLQKSAEPFQLHLLLGAPQDDKLESSYRRAKNILSTMPARPTLVEESEAEEFAAELARDIAAHKH